MRNIGSNQVNWKYEIECPATELNSKKAKSCWTQASSKEAAIALVENGVKIATICEIVKDNQVIGTGRSVCHVGDNFNKELGRRISLGRALQSAEIDKATRSTFWESYRTSKKVPLWELKVSRRQRTNA